MKIEDNSVTGDINLQNLKITGDLTVDTPNASVTVDSTTIVEGTTEIKDVASSTFTNEGTLGKVNITDTNGTRFVNKNTVGEVTINTEGDVTLEGVYTNEVKLAKKAKLTIPSNTTVSKLNVSSEAKDANIKNNGTITEATGEDANYEGNNPGNKDENDEVEPEPITGSFNVNGNYAIDETKADDILTQPNGTYSVGYSIPGVAKTEDGFKNVKSVKVELKDINNNVMATNTLNVDKVNKGQYSPSPFNVGGSTGLFKPVSAWDKEWNADNDVIPAKAIVTAEVKENNEIKIYKGEIDYDGEAPTAYNEKHVKVAYAISDLFEPKEFAGSDAYEVGNKLDLSSVSVEGVDNLENNYTATYKKNFKETSIPVVEITKTDDEKVIGTVLIK